MPLETFTRLPPDDAPAESNRHRRPSASCCRHIGLTAVARAIGLSRNSRVAAKVKAVAIALAKGPAAHSGAQPLQSDDTRLLRRSRRRQPALAQLEAEGFADDSVFRNRQTATDFACADVFVPQRDKCCGSFRSPFLGHCLYSRPPGQKRTLPVSRLHASRVQPRQDVTGFF